MSAESVGAASSRAGPAQKSIRPFYDQWPRYNRRLVDVVAGMSSEVLALRPDPTRAPVWAIAAHIAVVRVYWLCGVIGEPGAETTPFPDPHGDGWEDDEDTPRDAPDLVNALDTTWRIVDGCLDRWTPEMLGETFERIKDGEPQVLSRTSILQRLFSHDAYHCGELSQTLGVAGMRQIDLWSPEGIVREPGQYG
jgi:uncharacterized damage-inducible protein DinB